jgi:hypothetical protein
MEPDYPILTDDSHPEQAPRAEQSNHTIKDERWRVERYTPPGWSVQSIAYEFNDHSGAACTKLEATLEHETGATIECNPIDPWGHHAGRPIYRRHRIVLQDGPAPEPQVVTFDGDDPDVDHLPDTFEKLPAVLKDAPDLIKQTRREHVHNTDEFVTENLPDHGRGSTVDTINDAVLAIIAAAQVVAEHQKQQTLPTSAVSQPS